MSDFAWTEQDSINLTASLVALDGHRLALRGAEREAALRMMAARSVERDVMAWRLCITVPAVKRALTYYGIRQPAVHQHWSVAYIEPGKAPDRVRAAKQARRQRQAVSA